MVQLTAATLAFATSASAANLLVSHFSGGLYTLSYSNKTLTQVSTTRGCGNQPTWITLDSAAGNLYCLDESGGYQYSSGSVISSYKVGNDGSASLTASGKTAGGPVHGSLYGGSDGKGFFVTANYGLSSIATYKLPLTSSSVALQTVGFTMASKGPIPSRQDAPHPHSAIIDPTGKFVVVPDLGADLVRIYSINPSTGYLTACPSAQANSADGPRHAAFWAPSASSTNGQMLYTVNELSNSVTTWSVSYPSGGCMTLTRGVSLSTYPPNTTPPPNSASNPNLPAKAAEIHISGNFVYASNRNDQTFGSKNDSMAAYSINSSNGALSFLQLSSAGSWYPRTFAINKAGDMLAVGGQTTSNIVVVARNPTTGLLGSQLASINIATQGTNGGEDGLSGVLWDE